MKKSFSILIIIFFIILDIVFANDNTQFKTTQNKNFEKKFFVLCYHRFKKRKITDKKKKKWGDIYYLSPDMFEKHIKFLKENYSIISMHDLLEYMEGKKDINDNSVIITIDDGYKSIYTKAYPILKKYNVPATLFLYEDFIPGGPNALTKKQIKEMMKNGIEVGCHSKSHPVLTSRWQKKTFKSKKKIKLDDRKYLKFLEKEIIESKKYLEKYLKTKIYAFAYPYGTYSKEVQYFLEKGGYKLGFSVVPSYNTKDTNRFALKRTIIYNTTNIEKLKKILNKNILKIKDFYPADGDIIKDTTPELKAYIVDDSYLNTATIKFKMGRVILRDSTYNPTTKMLSHYYKKPLSKGTHVLKVIAEGKDGKYYEYAWLFIIGKPTKMTLLKDEENNLSEEVKAEVEEK